MIEIEQSHTEDSDLVFIVTVSDSAGSTQHRVTLNDATYQRLTGGRISPSACIDAAFQFLLDRQSKGDILPSFDLNVIQMSYANFAKDVASYM